MLSAIAVISDSRSLSWTSLLTRLWTLLSESVLGGAADASPSDGNPMYASSAAIRAHWKAVNRLGTLMANCLAKVRISTLQFARNAFLPFFMLNGFCIFMLIVVIKLSLLQEFLQVLSSNTQP
jgi:hypothetical protein